MACDGGGNDAADAGETATDTGDPGTEDTATESDAEDGTDSAVDSDTETSGCVPDCEGRECGKDFCGGSCGTCEAGFACADGLCACVPSCPIAEYTDDPTGSASKVAQLARQCGDDGCGGVCGECLGAAACNEHGVCLDPACAVLTVDKRTDIDLSSYTFEYVNELTFVSGSDAGGIFEVDYALDGVPADPASRLVVEIRRKPGFFGTLYDLGAEANQSYLEAKHAFVVREAAALDGTPGRVFFQTAGALVVRSVGVNAQGVYTGTLQAFLKHLTLVEATVDAGTGELTPQSGGACLQIPEVLVFDVAAD